MANLTCIKDADRCEYTSTTIYCCSGYCIQNLGEEYGYCATTATTTATKTVTSTTTSRSCLSGGVRCRSDGSLGICCSYQCNQLAGDESGVCTEPKLTQDFPQKCTEDGGECSITLPKYGLCCSRHCDILAPHVIGICARTKTSNEIIKQTENQSWVIYGPVIASITLMMLIGFFWLYRRQKKIERGLSAIDTEKFFNGDPEAVQFNDYAHESIDNLSYDRSFEIPDSDFTIDMKSTLGSGCFGLVLKANVKGMDVAAKTIRSNLNDGSHLRSLLSEIKTLQYVGTFENIVSMIGCNTSDLKNGKVFLFLELCPLGSLDKYLRKHKYNYAHTDTASSTNQYENFPRNFEAVLESGCLLRWSMQITTAMKFLADKKILHADLATRNILLLRKDCAKLTDFGLSRRLYEYGSYVKKQMEPLPWRWMAPESLQQLTFSHQSDVWALGITFWEIYTLGDVPYPGLSWTPNFIASLESNLRPKKPVHASDKLYGIMQDCWKLNPDARPSFDEIYRRFYEYSI